ncbi:hypothetical protein D9K79_12060 [Acinetobacter cumulans]|uniref:Uncharacterized protein n=1 Tax=Acinetobacter cumulans TaxID=2136182 RepID=A0ABX9U4B0_9GAMM|nr:hypothetical protein [Acinetobacter cumulans]QCO23017.1 hypothetical protein C9E88_015975 [Acinetobacter cumulans]QFU78770.1 hypothetical protein C9E88_17010 [Acinetobacter cumulans]RLL42522.1 hypothetical protein D9K79_12060 [Acinetobacter cumulans]
MRKSEIISNKLLEILFSSSNKTLQAYTLNQRLSVPPSDFFKLIFKLRDEKLLIIDGVFVKLTMTGEQKVLLNVNNRQVKETFIPKKFLSKNELEVNELYIPKRSLL